MNKIEHLIILMMENRSFNHYFGSLSLVEGRADVDGLREPLPTIKDNDGRDVSAWCMDGIFAIPDPPHGWDHAHDDYNGGRNDGFVRQYQLTHPEADARIPMGYYTKKTLPVFYALADQFTICDHWFSSVLSSTWPNRKYLHSGRRDEEKDTLGRLPARPGFRTPPIYGLLEDRTGPSGERLSWKCYLSDLPFLAFWYEFTVSHFFKFMRVVDFVRDCELNRLPTLSIIDPPFTLADEGQVSVATPITGPKYTGFFSVFASLFQTTYNNFRAGQRAVGAPHTFLDTRGSNYFGLTDFNDSCGLSDRFYYANWYPKLFAGEVIHSNQPGGEGWTRVSALVGDNYPTCWEEKWDWDEYERHYQAWNAYMVQLGLGLPPYWPNSTEDLPSSWRDAVSDSRFPSILAPLNAMVVGAYGAVRNPPNDGAASIVRGLALVFVIVASTNQGWLDNSIHLTDSARTKKPDGFCPPSGTDISSATLDHYASTGTMVETHVAIYGIDTYRNQLTRMVPKNGRLNVHHIIQARWQIQFGYASSNDMPPVPIPTNKASQYNVHGCLDRAISKVLPYGQQWTKAEVCSALPGVYAQWAPVLKPTVDAKCAEP
jgi:hypothetical protein